MQRTKKRLKNTDPLCIFFQERICNNRLTDYKEAVVVYIAGYVVKMVKKKILCKTCQDALICSREEAERNFSFALLNRKRWGQLIDASGDVIALCNETEKVFSGLLQKSEAFLPKKNPISSVVVTAVLKRFFLKDK